MEEKELVEHIYKDASMGSYTCMQLLTDLKNKDNKIKNDLENILKEYQDFEKKAKKYLKTEMPLEESFMTKFMAKRGIKKEVTKDNSDSAIAKMLIEGLTMGSLEIESKIKDYEKKVESDTLKLAKDFLKFQEQEIETLKKYL